MQTADASSMQATHGQSMGNASITAIRFSSTGATLVHPAPFAPATAADFTIPQRVARYGLTMVAIAATSAIFATQIASTLH